MGLAYQQIENLGVDRFFLIPSILELQLVGRFPQRPMPFHKREEIAFDLRRILRKPAIGEGIDRKPRKSEIAPGHNEARFLTGAELKNAPIEIDRENANDDLRLLESIVGLLEFQHHLIEPITAHAEVVDRSAT